MAENSIIKSRKSKYLQSMLLPDGPPVDIPDDKIRKRVLRQEPITANISAGVDQDAGSAVEGFIFIWPNHPSQLVGVSYKKNKVGKFVFDRLIETALKIEKDYDYARKTTQGITIRSATISTSNAPLSGTFNAARIQGTLTETGLISYQDIMALTSNPGDRLGNVLMSGGLKINMIPVSFGNDYVRLDDATPAAAGTPFTVSGNKIADSTGDLDYVATFGTASLALPTEYIKVGGLNFDCDKNYEINVEISSNGNPGANSGTVTLRTQLVDFFGGVIQEFETEQYIDTKVKYHLSTSINDKLSRPCSAVQFALKSTLTYTATDLYITARATAKDGKYPGRNNNVVIVGYTGATFGNQIVVSGTSNFQLIPNQQLARNVTTEYPKPDNYEMTYVKQILAHADELGIRSIMELERYNANRSYYDELANLDQHTIAESWGFGDLLKTIGKVAVPLASTLFPAAAPAIKEVGKLVGISASGRPVYSASGRAISGSNNAQNQMLSGMERGMDDFLTVRATAPYRTALSMDEESMNSWEMVPRAGDSDTLELTPRGKGKEDKPNKKPCSRIQQKWRRIAKERGLARTIKCSAEKYKAISMDEGFKEEALMNGMTQENEEDRKREEAGQVLSRMALMLMQDACNEDDAIPWEEFKRTHLTHTECKEQTDPEHIALSMDEDIEMELLSRDTNPLETTEDERKREEAEQILAPDEDPRSTSITGDPRPNDNKIWIGKEHTRKRATLFPVAEALSSNPLEPFGGAIYAAIPGCVPKPGHSWREPNAGWEHTTQTSDGYTIFNYAFPQKGRKLALRVGSDATLVKIKSYSRDSITPAGSSTVMGQSSNLALKMLQPLKRNGFCGVCPIAYTGVVLPNGSVSPVVYMEEKRNISKEFDLPLMASDPMSNLPVSNMSQAIRTTLSLTKTGIAPNAVHIDPGINRPNSIAWSADPKELAASIMANMKELEDAEMLPEGSSKVTKFMMRHTTMFEVLLDKLTEFAEMGENAETTVTKLANVINNVEPTTNKRKMYNPQGQQEHAANQEKHDAKLSNTTEKENSMGYPVSLDWVMANGGGLHPNQRIYYNLTGELPAPGDKNPLASLTPEQMIETERGHEKTAQLLTNIGGNPNDQSQMIPVAELLIEKKGKGPNQIEIKSLRSAVLGEASQDQQSKTTGKKPGQKKKYTGRFKRFTEGDLV